MTEPITNPSGKTINDPISSTDGKWPRLINDKKHSFFGWLYVGVKESQRGGLFVKAGVIKTTQGIFIAIQGFGAHEFRHPESLEEIAKKLGLHDLYTAAYFYDFISCQLGFARPVMGKY